MNAAQATPWVYFAADAHDGDAVICEGYRNLSGVLTANVTTPYVAGSIDLGEVGPVVVDVPAGRAGHVRKRADGWSRMPGERR